MKKIINLNIITIFFIQTNYLFCNDLIGTFIVLTHQIFRWTTILYNKIEYNFRFQFRFIFCFIVPDL